MSMDRPFLLWDNAVEKAAEAAKQDLRKNDEDRLIRFVSEGGGTSQKAGKSQERVQILQRECDWKVESDLSGRLVFTRGQFWPSGIVVACICVSVCPCINHLLVRAITRDPIKLGSPNLDQRCKTPWLRCLLFWGAIDIDLQGQI